AMSRIVEPNYRPPGFDAPIRQRHRFGAVHVRTEPAQPDDGRLIPEVAQNSNIPLFRTGSDGQELRWDIRHSMAAPVTADHHRLLPPDFDDPRSGCGGKHCLRASISRETGP